MNSRKLASLLVMLVLLMGMLPLTAAASPAEPTKGLPNRAAAVPAADQLPPNMSLVAPPDAQPVRPDGEGRGVESLSGSFVVFDPGVGGDTCFIPGSTQTFCFEAHSFTNDYEYVYNLWQKFPTDWTVTDVYVQGTPACTSGSWGSFSWSFQTSPYEVNIAHARYQQTTDECVAHYCFDVIAGTGAPDALESWYWDGDGYGGVPHWPCSNDGYTPAGQSACDQAVEPLAAIPPCAMDPIMLTPEEIHAEGCPCELQYHDLAVWNNTGADTNVDLTYTLIQGNGTCDGPAQVFVADGTNVPITVELYPQGVPGDDVVCEVYAEDATTPANNDTSWIYKHLIGGGFDPAGWQLEPIAGATGNQWAGGAVGTNPAAAGPVGYIVGGLGVGSSAPNPDLQMYDPGTGTWTQLTDMPNWRFSPATGFIGGLLYAAGGYDAAFGATADLQVYDPGTDTWDNTTPAELPALRGGGAGGVGTCSSGAGECLFHVGGGPDSSFANTTLETYQYDPAANAWTQLDNKPAGSSPDGHILGAGVGCLGHIYVGGDYRGFHDFFRLDATQPAGSQWTTLANIPAAAGAMTPAFVCKEDWGKIVLIGGDPDGSWGTYNTTVYVYDIATDTWDGPLAQTLNVGQLGSVGWHMYDRVWTAGGTVGSGAIDPMPFESLLQITCDPCPSGEFDAWKEAPDMAESGTVMSYTITIEADELVEGMYMEDPLPAGVEYAGNLTWTEGMAWYSPTVNTVYWIMPPTQAAATPPDAPPAVDATLGLPAPTGAPSVGGAAVPFGGGSTMEILDDFNRADGPIGADWTVQYGYCNVSSNAAVCGGPGGATFNSAPGDGNVAEADVAVDGTSLQFTGLMLNYGGGVTNPFLKVQQQSPYAGQFTHGACYLGNNGGGGSFGLGFFPLDAHFSTAHMRATRVGNDVTIEFTNIDGGGGSQTYVCTGAPAPEGTGIGIVGYNGIARLDNFGLPGGETEQVQITFDVTVTAYCDEVVVNEGLFIFEDLTIPFSATTYILGDPDIEVDAPPLSVELCPDDTELLTMTICNVGTCDLVWEMHEMTPTLKQASVPFVPLEMTVQAINPDLVTTSPRGQPKAVPAAANPEDVLWDQYLTWSSTDMASQDFETAYDTYDIYAADDFENLETWTIDTITTRGGWGGFVDLNNATALNWWICPDNGGHPLCSPPGDGNEVWSISLPPSDPQVALGVVEPEDVVLSLNTPVVLPAGTWWLVYQAALEYGLYGQYGWSAHSEATWGSIGEQINPGGGFGMGTDWWENSYGYDWMFRLEGTTGGGIVYPDYPWLSEYPVSGTIPPGECTVVDVNFDATGMAPGDYFADLLILSNDPDEPEITLPTAMTVLEAVEIVDVTYDITDLTVTFTPTVNGSEPIAYLWDFGDGVGTSTETNPVYTYAVEGCYTVTLDVVNECGADGWNGEVCVVSACDPVHDAALTWMPLMPIVSETVTFTGTAVGSEPISYAWDFGDGMTATGMVVTHAYAMSGTFTVTLMADNECGHDEAQGLITITEEPVEHYMIYLPVVQKDYLP